MVKVTLLIDKHEKLQSVGIVKNLIETYVSKKEQSCFEVKELSLSSGDFQIFVDDKCVWIIERKTFVDFRASFISNRLQDQVNTLIEARKNKLTEHIGLLIESMKLSEDNLKGSKFSILSMATILNRYRDYNNMEIFYTDDINGTAIRLFIEMHDLYRRSFTKNKGKTRIIPETPVNQVVANSAIETVTDNVTNNVTDNAIETVIQHNLTKSAELHINKEISKMKKEAFHLESWMLLPMTLSLLPKVSFERAKDISRNFDNSFATTCRLARTEPEEFRRRMGDKDNRSYTRSIPIKTIELALEIFSGISF